MKPIEHRKIRVMLVGCGRVSKNHLAALSKHRDQLELVALCDSQPKQSHALADEWKVPIYTELTHGISQSNPDLVALCTPSGHHAEQVQTVAKTGRHVLTEKPMATRYEDGIAMVNACDKANVHLFVVKQNRLNATLQLLRKAIDNERLGRLYMANAQVYWTRPQQYYDQANWRGTWEWDGGAFMNQASHYVDLLQWLMGPVDSVQAMMTTLGRSIEVEDTGVLSIRWRSGALSSMAVTMLTYPKNYQGAITVLGERGTVSIGGVALNEVTHFEVADPLPEDATIKQANYQTDSVYGHGHVDYYQNVIHVLRGTQTPFVDGREGLKTLELLTAAYRSARDRKTVYLPLVL